MAMSEHQKKDLQLKITIGVILALVLGTGYMLGPGLKGVIAQGAIDAKTEDWAPDRLYLVGRTLEHTFRKKEAIEFYEQTFYPLYRGDESAENGLWDVLDEKDRQDDDRFAYYIFWVDGLSDDWVGGEGAKPPPAMGKVLWRLAIYYEESRDYLKSKHLWLCIKHCFSHVDDLGEQATRALERDKARSY